MSRLRRIAQLAFLFLGVNAVLGITGPALVAAEPPANAFRFVHDADGHLKAAIDPEGESATYNWDVAGNLISISRSSSSKLSILRLEPDRGEVGETITIKGTGFSSTPASNTVKFSGTAATVIEASPWSLSVKVPTGAETGYVTVSTSIEGPATSPEEFSVLPASKTSISGISPVVATTGDEVTISGSGFDSSPSEGAVVLNRSRPEVVSASETAIKFKVPEATLGGRVSVGAERGSAAVGPDLYIPPNEVAASKVGATGRFTLGEATSTTLTKAGTIGLKLFDGRGGQRIEFELSEATFSGSVSIWSPRGVELAGSEATFTTSGGGVYRPIKLPETGTYTVRIEGSGEATGSVKLTAYTVKDITGSITPSKEGTKQSVSITTPGQNALYSVEVKAGQNISLLTSNASFDQTSLYWVEWLDPWGNMLASEWWSGKTGAGFWDPHKFTTSGTYTLKVDPQGSMTGSVDLTAYLVEDAIGSITPSKEGTKQSVSITTPGQNALYSVEVKAGQSLSVATSNANFDQTSLYWVEWLDSAGSVVASEWWSGKSGSGFCGRHEFTSAGTYTLKVNPQGSMTGSVDLTVWDAPDKTSDTITPSAEGGSGTYSVDIPGQRELISFSGEAGQGVSIIPSEANFSGSLSVFGPGGNEVSGSGGNLTKPHDSFTLPATGTYTIRLTGSGSLTGSVKLTAYTAKNLTGSITPTKEGTKQSVSITTPGQNALYSVEVKAGQSLSVATSNATFDQTERYWVEWLNPSGNEIAYQGWYGKTGSGFFERYKFPSAGTYTLRVDPQGTMTGSVDLTAYLVEDATGSITPTKEGTKQSVSITTPGQNALYSVEVKAGQSLSVATSNATFDQTERYWVEWLNPSGTELSYQGWYGKTGSGFFERYEFSSASTYTLKVDPLGSMTGTVDLTLWDTPDKTGDTITPSAEGGSGTYSVDIPGQRELITFSGEAGKTISIVPSEASFTGSFSVFSPSGGEVSSSKSSLSSPATFNLPATGTYTIRLLGSNGATGTVKLTAHTVKDLIGTITPSAEGTKQTVAITAPDQNALYSVEVKAGQSLSVATSNANFDQTERYWVEWLNPSGTEIVWQGWWGKTGSGYWRQYKFTSAGTYTLKIDPQGTMTGSVDLTVWDSSDKTGTITPTSEGESSSVSIDAPDQRELVTFSGSSGATVTLKVKEATFSGAMSVWKPDGNYLSGSERSFSSTSTARAEISLPESGTYTIQLTGPGQATGSGVLVAYLGSHVAWRSPASSTTQLVSFNEQRDWPDGPSGSVPAHASSQDRQAEGVTARMRNYQPSAAPAWHPARTSQGVRGWEAGEAISPWADLAPLHAAPATTALAGQVLGINGLPLVDVRVSLEGSSISATTDQTGRFLLAGAPGHQKLVVDGETADSKRRYGSYEVGVELANDKTTALDYTVWLTPLNRSGDQRIQSPTRQETRLTTPRIPGLEVRIPAGTVIRDAAGHVVRKLNLSPIPVDRPPFPLPPFVSVPLYFTVQPGRAYLSKGAQIIYPNWGHLPSGQRVDFWNYDADDRGWYVYGKGTVTPNGKQVVPDPGVRVWEFTGAMISSSSEPPPDGPIPGGGSSGGDPVDMYTGLFTYHKNDVMLPDSVPVSIQRTYRQGDTNSYSFGTGATSLYDMRLWSNNNYKEADLILPDSGRVHYVRISEGTGYSNAVYRSTSSPGRFFGSVITWDGSIPGWNLKLTNGYTYVFGEMAPLQAIRDPYGNTLTLKRTSGQSGNITKISSPHGRWAKLSYDSSNRVIEVTDNGGRHLKYAYTSGLLTEVKGLGGRTTKYEYDGSGRMKAIIDPRGNKYIQNVYDANGRVEKQTIAGGGTFQFSYKLNEAGKPESTTLTEPLGNQRKVEFNSEGFPTSETEALGTEQAQTTSFERQPATGLVLSTTDPLGREITFEYDTNGNVKEVTRLAGTSEAETSNFAYEPGTSRLVEATDPLGHTTEYQYGPSGELLKRIDPLGHETSFEYNADGQPTAITNPEGETSKLAYEGGDLVSTTNALGNTTRRFVDALGRLRSVTLPGGERYLYGYNEADEQTSSKTPSGAETTIEYDADGNPTAITDPRGGETTMSYDAMDRLIAETDPLEHTAEYSYDKAGDLVESIDRRGKVSTFGYDDLRRLTTVSYGVSGEASESSIAYAYDKANRLTEVSDSAAGEYTLSYDNLNRLTSEQGPTGDIAYEYDAAGRRTSMEVPGRTIGYEYDNANRLTKLTSGTQTVSVAYDKADRPQELMLPDGIKQIYGYDKGGETTSIAYKDGESNLGEIDYAYDSDGQTEAMWGSYARLSLPEALKSTKYNAANELVEREGKALSYDTAGDLTSDGSNEYSWNARGQLTKISGSTSASFGYDPFGLRISKTLGGTTTKFLYDGPNVVQESIGESVSGDLLTGLAPDQIFSRTTNGGTSSYLTNRLGSTIALANSSAKVKTSYTYDPFGGPTKIGEATDNQYQFTGRENDGTGLQYNRARYYSPSMGRFISQDPAGFEGSGINLYGYVLGNPVDYTDPSGECPLCDWGYWDGWGDVALWGIGFGTAGIITVTIGPAVIGTVATGLALAETSAAVIVISEMATGMLANVAGTLAQGAAKGEIPSASDILGSARSGVIGGAVGGAWNRSRFGFPGATGFGKAASDMAGDFLGDRWGAAYDAARDRACRAGVATCGS